MATTGDNKDLYVADLAIDPITKEIDWSNCTPIPIQVTNSDQVRENMKQLLDMIIGFFEVEAQKVDSGTLKEEEMLLTPYVQEFDTDTKHPTRSLPPGFIRRRDKDPACNHASAGRSGIRSLTASLWPKRGYPGGSSLRLFLSYKEEA